MIFLTPSQLREVEYLVSQSKSGIHHLFTPMDIKIAYSSNCEIDTEEVDQVKDLFFEFISQETIESKRSYYDLLDVRQKTLVIRTYFNVVENDLVETQSYLM